MTKILWFSKQCMDGAQITDLQKIYGDELTITQCKKQIKDWREVVELGKDADVLAVVLPPKILKDLTNPLNNTKPVIQSRSNRVKIGVIVNSVTGEEEAEYIVEHAGWEQVKKVEI